MLSIHCKKCNQLISDSYLLCFLTNETNTFELTSKLETKDKILLRLIFSNDNINEYACKHCLQIVCFISIHQKQLSLKLNGDRLNEIICYIFLRGLSFCGFYKLAIWSFWMEWVCAFWLIVVWLCCFWHGKCLKEKWLIFLSH